MKLEKVVGLKFEDQLTKYTFIYLNEDEVKNLTKSFRPDFILNNSKLFKHSSEAIFVKIDPATLRRRRGKNFYKKIKDFNWEEFEKNFSDLNSSSKIQSRIYSKFRSYFTPNRFLEFMVGANLKNCSTVDTDMSYLSDNIIEVMINNIPVKIDLQKFNPNLALNDLGKYYPLMYLLYKFNPYIKQEMNKTGYLITGNNLNTKYADTYRSYFDEFSVEMLRDKRLWSCSSLRGIFCKGDYFYFGEYSDQISKIIKEIPQLKYIFGKFVASHSVIFYEYSDFLKFRSMFADGYTTCNVADYPLNTGLIEQVLDSFGKSITEQDILDNLDHNVTDLIRKKLKKDRYSTILWEYLVRYRHLLFKDLKLSPGYLKDVNLFSFTSQRRLIKRDMLREYQIKMLCKLDF